MKIIQAFLSDCNGFLIFDTKNTLMFIKYIETTILTRVKCNEI